MKQVQRDKHEEIRGEIMSARRAMTTHLQTSTAFGFSSLVLFAISGVLFFYFPVSPCVTLCVILCFAGGIAFFVGQFAQLVFYAGERRKLKKLIHTK